MPGRYSHGVVLAQHSRRGLISLPGDQYAAYVNSSPLATTARPRLGSNATTVSARSSSRPGPEDNIRQRRSVDQLSANAYRTLPQNVPRDDKQRQVIIDLESEIDGALSSFGNATELRRLGSAIRSSSAQAAATRTPGQPRTQNTAVSAAPAEPAKRAEMEQQTSELEHSSPRRAASASAWKSEAVSSARTDLPSAAGILIGKPSRGSAAASKVATPPIGQSSRSTTPKLSSTGTNRSLQTTEPPTTPSPNPLRFAAVAEKWSPGGGSPIFSHHTDIYNPAAPSPDFDYFSGDHDTKSGGLARVSGLQTAFPEDPQLQTPPLVIPRGRPVQQQDSALNSPDFARFQGLVDSQSPLSSLHDMGIPSLIGTTQKQQKSPVHDTPVQQPSTPDSFFHTTFDPSLLEPGTPSPVNESGISRSDGAGFIDINSTLLQYQTPLGDPFEYRKVTWDSDLDSAVPPDISRHRTRNGFASPMDAIEQTFLEQVGLQPSNETISSSASQTVTESGRGKLSETPYTMVKKSRSFFGRAKGK